MNDIVLETTAYECGCVVTWRVVRLEPTPLVCPVHGKVFVKTDSEAA